MRNRRAEIMARSKKKDRPRAQNTRIVCFEALEQPPDHDLSDDPEKQARRQSRGDVQNTRLTPTVASYRPGQDDWILNSPIGNPRLVYIHVVGVPEKRWQNLRKQMQERLYVDQAAQNIKTRDRKWRVNIKDLPPGPRNTLLTERQVTMQWDVFRSRLCKKVIHDPYKPEDDTDAPIEDADIPEET